MDRYIKKLVPIGFLHGLDVLFTTAALTHGAIAFVEMIKSGSPVILLIEKFISGHHSNINSYTIISIVILCVGQILIYFHEENFSIVSFICSIIALITAGTRLYVIEILMKPSMYNTRQVTPRQDSSLTITPENESLLSSQNSDDIIDELETIKGPSGIGTISALIVIDQNDIPLTPLSPKKSKNKEIELEIELGTDEIQKQKILSKKTNNINDYKPNFKNDINDILNNNNNSNHRSNNFSFDMATNIIEYENEDDIELTFFNEPKKY